MAAPVVGSTGNRTRTNDADPKSEVVQENVAHSHWASPPQAKEQARVSESSASDSAGIAPKAAPELTLAVIESLKMKGYSQSDIARMYGVSRQAVSWHKRHYGGRLSPRETVRQHFPWSVPTELGQCSPYKRLRDHGEYVATRGVGMSSNKIKRLRAFYKKLRENELVVEFDPTIPPNPGVAKRGGFAYRKRSIEDEDFLIRVNEHTYLTEEGKGIWRFPSVDP